MIARIAVNKYTSKPQILIWNFLLFISGKRFHTPNRFRSGANSSVIRLR
jgi:hypothetical protein